MSICIKNATLISMSENREKVEKGIDILIENNIITKIEKNIEVNENMKVIDAIGKVVLPGLINTHAHIPMSIFRETLDGYSLQEWLNNKIWPMEDKLTQEDIYYSSFLSFIEMIKTGCTTINDMYFMTDSIIKAAKEAKIRIQTTRTLMNLNGQEEGNKRIEELERMLNKYKDEELVTFNIGIHGLYTASREYVKTCKEIAEKYNLPIHIHFCENAKEVQDIIEKYNEQPVEILEKELTNCKLILAHCVKLLEKEIEQLSKLDISISHCPISNLKLGCGIANINKMLEQNINVSIGTDGQGSGSNLDLFESMKYTALLQKGINENPKQMEAYDVLKMVTINGAKALGLENVIGSIEEGKIADIIIIDMDKVITNPINNIISQIIYNVKGTNVDTTIINGRILMENRKLNNIDEKYYIDMCNKIIDRISN